MSGKTYDIAVIGGGVNGCGVARDAAGRGLSVLLTEKGDLANATSSASTKLIHGGLRYLEFYEFRLVREALKEREVLLEAAPHIIRVLRFVLPHHDALRPAWLIRFGLFLYDHLGGRDRLPACHAVDLATDPVGKSLKPKFRRGFEYSDCWVDDARLVVLNALDASERGADIRVRSELVCAERRADFWHLTLKDSRSGACGEARARSLVNAAGPWVAEVASRRIGLSTSAKIRLVKGSHIVVPKIFDHDRAYIFQNTDRRMVFAIPYEGDFTLIGTTDVDVEGEPGEGEYRASAAEIAYLCRAVGEYFENGVEPSDVVWSYAGVRPLFDDGGTSAQETTRDYVLKLHGGANQAPVLNIFGGKITTYRELAEEALAKLRPRFPAMGRRWTKGATLPGGDFPVEEFEQLVARLRGDFSMLEPAFAHRLARTYGTRARNLLGAAKTRADLGLFFGADLYQREVEYLIDNEWAETAEDILWRRSKLGLRFTREQAENLARWLRPPPASRTGPPSRS